jgi:hypothetical protein
MDNPGQQQNVGESRTAHFADGANVGAQTYTMQGGVPTVGANTQLGQQGIAAAKAGGGTQASGGGTAVTTPGGVHMVVDGM